MIPWYRYKLEADVSYEDHKSTFVIWDREVTQLLGISAAQLRTNLIQVIQQFSLMYKLLVYILIHFSTIYVQIFKTTFHGFSHTGWDN